MTMHKDYVIYSLSKNGYKYDDTVELDFNTNGQKGNWIPLGDTTLATGAFPIAFKPRELIRDASSYNRRLYSVPTSTNTLTWGKITPSWTQKIPIPYNYWTVDGGTMNNEPIELARKALADKTGRNCRDELKASRMLLLIDPFPNEASGQLSSPNHGELVGSVMRLLGTWKNQARIKLEDLKLFGDQTVFSRFVIAPSNVTGNGPLACGSLGAFGGLLDVNWRHHDYLLGRLNCQTFLKKYFVLDINNRIFAQFPDSQQQLVSDGKARIIPLVNGMDDIEAAVQGLNGSNIDWPEGL